MAAPGLGKLLFLPSVLCELDFCPWAGAWLGGAGRDALGRAVLRGEVVISLCLDQKKEDILPNQHSVKLVLILSN